MQEKIIKEYIGIQKETVWHIKTLLDDINIIRNKELEAEIEQLKNELREVKKLKKYWLVWEEKQEFFDKQTIWKLPVLKEVKENDVINNDTESNILIEWDNYHTLSVLNYTHKWKIDVIYIDPPYNTWNNDDTWFIYNDKIVDKEDKFKHSKWLSFMSKRLRLAKNLLTEDWIIFISIDDNEFSELKLLSDEIFWSENFITSFIWEKTQHFWRQKINFYSNVEYILCYSNKLYQNQKLKELLVEYIKEEHEDAPLYNAWNKENILNIPKWKVKFNIDDWIYNKTTNNKYKLIESVEVVNWYNNNDLKIQLKSRWSQKTINEELEKWCIFWVKSTDFSLRVIYWEWKISKESPRKMIFSNWINPQNTISRFWIKVWTSENWSNELNNIVNQNVFNYPKPKSLIQYLLSLIFNEQEQTFKKNLTILDFFAGSWTTGQAILELNKEDWWNRKFILATNNENNICKEVTYERVKRVINWYKNSKWENVEWLWWNLKYLRTDFIDKHKSNDDLRERMVNRCTELLCLKENIWEEVKQKNDKIKIFKRNDKYLAVLYDMFYFDEFKKILFNLDKQVSIYAFSHYKLLKEDFEDIKIPFEIEDIPDPILEVYDTIFWL